jgi:hypothetical protein
MTAKGGWMTVLVLRRRFALERLSDEVAWSKAVQSHRTPKVVVAEF